MEKLLTVKEVAEILNISASTLQHGSLQDQIPRVKFGGNVRYKQSDIDKYIMRNTERITSLKY